LTAAQGRKFGLTVGIAFLVLAAIARWRGHPLTFTVLASLGGLLAAGGLLVPSYMGPVERAWMGMAHAISKVTTPIVMGAVYFGVLTPVGLVMRLTGRNPLRHADAGDGFWKVRAEGSRQSGDLRRQF
jgi:hypothetical protein